MYPSSLLNAHTLYDATQIEELVSSFYLTLTSSTHQNGAKGKKDPYQRFKTLMSNLFDLLYREHEEV